MINVSVPVAPSGVAEPPLTAHWLGESAAGRASIDAYLAAGDRMARLMSGALRACAVLFVLVLLTWGLGLLPGAVRLF